MLRWLTDAPDFVRSELRWFIDGSVVDARRPELTVAAAALVAFAEACISFSVSTAPAAEVCGLMLAVTSSVGTPWVVDCQSLLATAAGASARATAASPPLAWVWDMIATAVDGGGHLPRHPW